MDDSRITLQEHLDKYGWLRSRMVAKSILIDEVEIYGFINCSKEMLDEYKTNEYKLLGIVDKDPSRQIIQCNYIYQIIEWFDGNKAQQTGLATPIYVGLRKCVVDTEINVEELYIPDLINHKLYKDIRSRKGTGIVVTEQLVNKYKSKVWTEHNILIKNGKAMMPIHKGDILCQHIMDNSIKSIGQELLAVCRYIHKTTGRMCYTQYGLDELTVKNEEYDLL
ncbi:MAG: hypothetical protein IJ057_08715 [Bacteroidales bacterium]|nr:hypothetical protein [Bacteroidales bacterium]